VLVECIIYRTEKRWSRFVGVDIYAFMSLEKRETHAMEPSKTEEVKHEDDDDDPVIEMYDVFVNQDMTGALNILQFPLRPVDRPYDMNDIVEVRVGVSSNRISLHMEEAIQDCPFFPPDRLGSSGSDMLQYTLRGGVVMGTAEIGMHVAIYRPGEVHLTPISYVQQLRKDLAPFDAVAFDEIGEGTGVKSVAAVQSVKQWSTHVEDERREENRTLRFYAQDRGVAKVSAEMLALLLSQTHEPWMYPAGAGPAQSVLHQICPVMPTTDLKPSPDRLGDYPLERQVYGLLVSAQVLSLRSLKAFLCPPPSASPESIDSVIIKALTECGVLIRGYWVSKLAPLDRQIPLRTAILREYIILQIYLQTNGLSRDELLRSFPPSLSKTVTELLSSLCVLDKTTRRWVLKGKGKDSSAGGSSVGLESDEVVHNQRMKWQSLKEEIQQNFTQLMQLMTTGSTTNQGAAAKPILRQAMPWAPPPPQMMRGGPSSIVAGGSQSEEEVIAQQDVLSVLRNLYSTHGVITGQQLMPLLMRDKTRPGSRIANLSVDNIRRHMKLFVVKISDTATILRKWDDPLIDEFRPKIIEFFRKNPSGTRDDIQSYVRKILQDKDIPDKVFRRVSSELAEYKANDAKWTLKSGIVP